MVFGRVVALTIPLSLWNLLVRLLAPLPQLEKLTLAFWLVGDLRSLLAERTAGDPVISCPRLCTLALAAVRNSVVITFEDVRRTICDLLRAPGPIALKLQNVWSRGWAEWTKRVDLFNSVRLRERSDL